MSYSCNDNQNYFVSETGRTTSRVLNPPGGASSFSLGSDDATASSKKKSSPPKPPASEVQKSIQDEGTAAPSVVANQGSEGAAVPSTSANAVLPTSPMLPGHHEQQSSQQPVSSNAFASGANMNGPNVMTGRPTSRVLAPPGGHSALGGSLW